MAGVAYYTIAGKQVGGHYLAIAWLATMFGGVKYAMSGPSKPNVTATPPINASSSEEGDFIKNFLQEQDKKH
ncbi:Fc.00g092100.m01.CDS01 [Cosmosporella sp. VM-42]